MIRRIILLCTGCLLGLCILDASTAEAQLVWRVSVKFILSANGLRPPSGNINTDAEVQAQIDLANEILDAHGRGYRLQLTEIVNVAGISGWFSTDLSGANKDALEAAAIAAPATYVWRTSAINVYINNDDDAGICSFPGDNDEIIWLGQGARTTSLIHEIGHYLNLCHTMGCPCGSCGAGSGDCNTVPVDDEIDDTIEDLECWDQNDIADNWYGLPYASLSIAQKDRVDDVFNNIMSYHGTRNRWTEDQLDRKTCASNGVRATITNGDTRIVGTQTGPEQCQSPSSLYGTVASAVVAAASGDIILMRGSSTVYTFTGIVSKALTLRSSRGSSFLGTQVNALVEAGEIKRPELPNTGDGKTGP